MFENNLIAGVSGQGGGYSIEDSLRFNDNDSAYLSRTPATAGNRKTWTWSGWVKRGNINTRQALFATNSGTAGHTVEINSTDTLRIFNTGTGASVSVETTPVFRDVSGWYHIVLVADTTQATASNRIKFYVNGTLITNYAVTTYPSLNADLEINNNIAHNIGNRPLQSFYFDGYLAEINFIDGQALTPDDFGEINADTGEWSPKAYSGTYGTNGFYLPFDGNANDDSGNGNNWTENNLASTDYMIDTPTNNFSVFNVLSMGSTFSNVQEGNLEFYRSSATSSASAGTMAVSSGKYYYEIYLVSRGSTGASFAVGIQDASLPLSVVNGYAYYFLTGQFLTFGAGSAYGSILVAGDILGVAYDLDAGTLTFYKNGVSLGVATSSLPSASYIPLFVDGGGNNASLYSSTQVLNFGADSSFAGNKTRQGNTDANGIGDFYYEPPAGYLALCTENLPAPAIEQPETQFNVVTYTGDGTSSNAITGVGFQPDFVWIKQRNSTASHQLQDSVRGAGKILFSNDTSAEQSYNTITSFDSDGFTAAVDGVATGTNASGGTYVAWCWKAGGTAVTNTDGSITSQVSANVDAGFSIVSYTGNGIAGASIGHGLSQAPELIISKNRNGTDSGLWAVYADPAGSTKVGVLNATDAFGTFSNFNSTAPTSSVWYTGATSGTNSSSSSTYIAYCFHSVEGFSKFGSYVGNGSTNGTFVYTGFKPAFVMVKRTDAALYNWIIFDSARDPSNQVQRWLFPNLANAEGTGLRDDMLSNGFKIRQSGAGVNASGGTYIYMAFAEHPFNYATGR